MTPAPAAGLPPLPAELVLRTPRLVLEPLTRDHTDELRTLHADPHLFRFTRRPRHLDAGLDDWLAAQERRRSPAGAALWLTWLLRPAPGGPAGQPQAGPGPARTAVGQVQATVVAGEDGPQAELSWLLARPAQGRGLAGEAAGAVARWLAAELGVRRLHAHITPGHAASERLAARLGLQPSGEVLDGERRWSGPPPR